MTEGLHRLPKAELHVHLDGSLRPGTLLALAEEREVQLPVTGVQELADYMTVTDASSLEDYLERFDVTLSVMQDAGSLERIAYELALDHDAEGVRYVEMRFCPLLNTEHGLTAEEAVDAVLAGTRLAEGEVDIRVGIIVCALRTLTPSTSVELAELAIAYRDRGVCGFDLAGAESGYPVRDHADAFRKAADGGVPITIHAGEGYGPASIREALEIGHARRIGHGTRLGEDPELLEQVRSLGIPLEVCLTSNVQTGVVSSIADHPARTYLRAGLPLTLSTDNRLMSGVTLSDEFEHAEAELGLSRAELVDVARAGFEHAFLPHDERRRMLEDFDRAVTALDDVEG